LLIAALNNMNVLLGADISSAYRSAAPTMKKVWTILRPEWGSDSGKSAIIVWALYGLKSPGAAYWNNLASYLQLLGF
jgi:hypothetical protein